MEMISMDCKGQAAVTDALYFLSIITGLCILLFSYSSGYGVSVDSLISKKYNSDFCTDSLRTILYSSTPRNSSDSIYTQDAEIDYLLAYIKEDYYAIKGFNKETMLVLQKNIKDVLAPKAGSFDYLFTLSLPSDEEYLFVLMHISNYSYGPGSDPGRRTESVVRDESKPKVDLFCGYEAGPPVSNSVKVNDIKSLLAKLSSTVQASTRILLISDDESTVNAQADLIMWTPAIIETLDYYKTESNWKCIEVSDFLPSP